MRFEWIPFEPDDNGRFACGQALAWLVFLATAVHLAFLVPSPNGLMPGERAKVFSGFLCSISLLPAILFGKKGTIRPRSPELWISLTLLVLMVLSTIFSTDPRSSIPRAFVVPSAGFSGFWCARLLLYNRKRTEIFLNVCLFLFTAILVAGTVGILFFDDAVQLIDTNWHTVGGRIFLPAFAPIALRIKGTGAKRVFGVLWLVFGYEVLLFSGRATGAGANVLIPAAMCCMALLLRRRRMKHAVVLIGLLMLMCGGFVRHLAVHCGHIDLHLLVYDGLFHPQSSWYLHVLLGLVPLGAPSEQNSS